MKIYIHYSDAGTLRLMQCDIDSMPRSGPADESIDALLKIARISAQLDVIGHDAMARHLEGYGAWDAEEFADQEAMQEAMLVRLTPTETIGSI